MKSAYDNAAMATLPMYIPPPVTAHPYTSRRVFAPGGSESWYFAAIDASRGRGIAIHIVVGDDEQSRYTNAVRQFLSSPTRITPPTPRDFITCSFSIQDPSMPMDSATCQVSRDVFQASTTNCDLTCGPVQVHAADNSIDVVIENFKQMSGTIKFTSQSPSDDAFQYSGDNSGARLQSKGKIATSVQLMRPNAQPLAFEGVGSHQYHYTLTQTGRLKSLQALSELMSSASNEL